MNIPLLNEEDLISRLKSNKNPLYADCYAFYSSWYGGIIKSPEYLMLPLDDHLVHRGDGVFEAMKAVQRHVYLMDEHLKRLFRSAQSLYLETIQTYDEIKNIVIETLRVANRDNALIRIFLSRGPGSFSVSPYESVGSQLYIVITKLNTVSKEKVEQGVTIGQSELQAKPKWMANIKSCNYLDNVLMKKEAVDRKLDFIFSVDEEGVVTEGATENIMIVDQNGALVRPPLDSVLRGTILIRACELASQNGIDVVTRPFKLEDLLSAREIILTGTTLNILPAVKVENHQIADGKPGPIAKKLNELLKQDMASGEFVTEF